MSDKKKMRKRVFVDAKVQGALALRVVLYWVICLVTVMFMILCWRILTGPARMFQAHLDELWAYCGPALAASFVLLPLVIVDVVRLSNRFTGPLLRLRRSMRELGRGEHVEPLRFRGGDFWQELADEFNAVVARIEGQPNQSGSEPREEDKPEALIAVR